MIYYIKSWIVDYFQFIPSSDETLQQNTAGWRKCSSDVSVQRRLQSPSLQRNRSGQRPHQPHVQGRAADQAGRAEAWHQVSLCWVSAAGISASDSIDLPSLFVHEEGWRMWWRKGWRTTTRSRSCCSLQRREGPLTPTMTTSAWWTSRPHVKRTIPQISCMRSSSSPWSSSTHTPCKL